MHNWIVHTTEDLWDGHGLELRQADIVVIRVAGFRIQKVKRYHSVEFGVYIGLFSFTPA